MSAKKWKRLRTGVTESSAHLAEKYFIEMHIPIWMKIARFFSPYRYEKTLESVHIRYQQAGRIAAKRTTHARYTKGIGK